MERKTSDQTAGTLAIRVQRFVRRILCGDNCEVMREMPSESVDLVVTSPPYDDLRTYGGHSWDFYGVAWNLKRLLKPGGVCVWVVNDATEDGNETGSSMEQALHFRRLGLNLHDTMIYRTNKFPSNCRRYEPCWEYMFVVSKGVPKTWNPLREKSTAPGAKPSINAGMRSVDGEMRQRTYTAPVGETKVKDNIWYLPRSPHSDGGAERHGHPATFPLKLAKDHIASWSNPGDVVLDPFCGSGTTCKAAKEMERLWIGIDVNAEYCRMAENRLLQDVLPLEACDNTPNDQAHPTAADSDRGRH